MEDDTEKALLALANPITWVGDAHSYGGNGSPYLSGRWKGESERASYQIILSGRFPHVDLSPLQRSSRLVVQIHNDAYAYEYHVATIDQGKALCLHHALTGDLAELEAVDLPIQEQNKAFEKNNRDALAQLDEAFKQHPPRWLSWQPDDPNALKFACVTPRGTYTARFDADRRWVVTLTKPDGIAEERCFLVAAITKMACSLHAQTSEWCGVLDPEDMHQEP